METEIIKNENSSAKYKLIIHPIKERKSFLQKARERIRRSSLDDPLFLGIPEKTINYSAHSLARKNKSVDYEASNDLCVIKKSKSVEACFYFITPPKGDIIDFS